MSELGARRGLVDQITRIVESENSMTRKHFEAIANIMRKARHVYREVDLKVVESIEKELAEYLGETNSLFNTQRFLDACRKVE